MSPNLTPIAAVFGIMLLGALVQKCKVLPRDSDNILNQYVYYVAFPAIMFIALAQTPFASITQWGFIFALSLSMVATYAIALGLSLWASPKQSALGAIRALNATFGNTAFIGIPLLTMLFPQDNNALVAAAIASLLSVIMFAFALVSIEIATSKALKGKKTDEYQPQVSHPLMVMLKALASNPIVIASAMGVVVSAAAISLPESLSQMLHQVGNTSSPCALFAIGMVLTKAMHRDSASQRWDKAFIIELNLITLLKLLFQPALSYCLMSAFNVQGNWLIMGVMLASLPTAASVYLLAQRYQVHTAQSAFAILLSTVLTFISLPIIEGLLTGIS
jgi:malonate transporter and related proteins